ncbi:MAG TPA: rhodanese-like domain-containing protein [Solirubrobacteraceae bacterium]|nr:rhodanese-like domain-containing protein [Solirubrobacteraceae bacterium]
MRASRRGTLAPLLIAALAAATAHAGHGTAGPLPVVPAPALKAELDAGRPPHLVDLRPAEAYRQGRLPGARSIPIRELRRRHVELPRGRLVLYCDCPREELEAAYRFLVDRGAERVDALEEGFAGWTKRGYPVER